MCMTTLIVTNCIIVLNFSLRSPSTHNMSQTIKHVRLWIFLLNITINRAEITLYINFVYLTFLIHN